MEQHEDLDARQLKIEDARAALAKLEAEEAARLHGQLKAFNDKKNAAYADLRENQDKLNAEYRITAEGEAEERARQTAAYWLQQEQAAVAKLQRVLRVVEIWESAVNTIAACRPEFIAELADLREIVRDLSPNGSGAGCDQMECVNRLTDRMGASLRASLRGSGSLYFGRINVATIGTLHHGKETGWREREEKILAEVVESAIASRRAHG